jgi:hypothetical protein
MITAANPAWLERIDAMFAEYMAAAWVLGALLGSLLT